MGKLTHLPTWQALQTHYQAIADCSMQEWFASDPLRFSRFSLKCSDILVDFSKNRITDETIRLLCGLAKEAKLAEKITALFTGKPINLTEKRAALHTALRDRTSIELYVNNNNIMPDIQATLAKMHQFTDKVRHGNWLGATGKPIRDIVNIGIGGSHLGPYMATHALQEYALQTLRCYFISNIDGMQINQVLQQIDPERTLFIISSKSFSTIETIANTKITQTWLRDSLGSNDLSPHFIAITAAPLQAKQFGIPDSHIFPIWEWVGGRYSVWSAIGLPLALMIGMDNFYEFLDGAHAMDMHFRHTDFSKNIPVILGLLGIWYINFFGCSNHVIAPYSYELNYFCDYIQQADMESNGKMATFNNSLAEYATGPIILGKQGCESQHSYFQLLHQGPRLTPVDFILVAESAYFQQNQPVLIASALSQAQALLYGKSYQDALTELQKEKYSAAEATHLALHQTIPGNRPSNALFIKKLTPHNLGALIALYEHKIFVQGALWNINSFDQWGVMLGKQLLTNILTDLQHDTILSQHDSSTEGLIQYYKNSRNGS